MGAPGGYGKARRIREQYAEAPNRCLTCERPILPRPAELLKDVRCRRFCSRACAATTNNRRRARPRSCALCPAPRRSKNAKYCKPCNEARRTQVGTAALTRTKADCSVGLIGVHARKVTRHRPQVCEVCGYSKHVEVCHLRPIYGFPATATIAEINDPTNLTLRCPNCHWELDHPGP